MEKGAAPEAGEQIKWQVFETGGADCCDGRVGDANTRFMGSGKNLTFSTKIVYIILGCGHRDTICSAQYI